MPLKVIAFNANDIWRRWYELGKQLQDLYIEVAVLSETHLKLHIPSIGLTASREEKAFPIIMYTYAICAIRTLDKCEAC
jgi:hypothetical protein